jgi:hypothetical protein
MNEILETKKYFIVKNAVSKEILEISKIYYEIKFLILKQGHVSVGKLFTEEPDIVQPYSVRDYADTFTESLLIKLLPKMIEITGLPELLPSYSFVRFYEKGQWLGKHSDRPSCQYSITLPLMSYDNTPWIIYMENEPIDLNLGDMVIYKGCEAQHWREPYEGLYQTQAHLHYVNSAEKAYKPYVYDGRPSLGMKR